MKGNKRKAVNSQIFEQAVNLGPYLPEPEVRILFAASWDLLISSDFNAAALGLRLRLKKKRNNMSDAKTN